MARRGAENNPHALQCRVGEIRAWGLCWATPWGLLMADDGGADSGGGVGSGEWWWSVENRENQADAHAKTWGRKGG